MRPNRSKKHNVYASAKLENGRNGMPVYVILIPAPTHIDAILTHIHPLDGIFQ